MFDFCLLQWISYIVQKFYICIETEIKPKFKTKTYLLEAQRSLCVLSCRHGCGEGGSEAVGGKCRRPFILHWMENIPISCNKTTWYHRYEPRSTKMQFHPMWFYVHDMFSTCGFPLDWQKIQAAVAATWPASCPCLHNNISDIGWNMSHQTKLISKKAISYSISTPLQQVLILPRLLTVHWQH